MSIMRPPAGSRRPMFMGRMEEVPQDRMAVTPPHEQVEEYLSRLQGALPFPADPMEVYLSTVPEEAREWVTAAGRPAVPGIVNNLLGCLTYSPANSIVHFTADEPMQHLAYLNGAEKLQHIFWLKFDTPVLAPSDTIRKPLLVPPEYAGREAVQRWAEARSVQRGELIGFSRMIEQFDRLYPTRDRVSVFWPDLLKFVAYPRHGRKYRPNPELEEKFEEAFPLKKRTRLIELLTTATMMPEVEYETTRSGVFFS